jgi:ribosomal protein S10
MFMLCRTKDQTPKADSSAEEPAKESSSETQAAAPTNATEVARDVNPEEHLEPPERPEATKGEIEVQQAEPTEFARVVPGEPVAEAEVTVPEPSSTNEAALPRFNDAFIKSAFQQVKLEGAEIAAGLSEVVARQIEAAEAAATQQQEDIMAPRPDDAFERSMMHEMGTLSAQIQASLREFEELGEARRASQEVETIIEDSADNAPHNVSPSAAPEEVLGEPQSRGQETLEAASVASQSQAPEAAAEQDTTEAAVETQSGSVETAEIPAALLDEVVKVAEEVRETEEVGRGETETSEPVVLTNTEAQDIVNEQIAKTELDKTPPQKPASVTEASKKEARKSKHDKLSAAAEKELGDKTEEKAAQLVETFEEEDDVPDEPSRMPRNVQAFYLQPLRREAKYNVPSCNLQLRSYSVRPLESFCDFALRAAYYLGLPAYGPTPLPKIIQRWTVPKSSFIFKKSQENFERITRRRLIQIRDGHPETVQIWLAFLQKHQQAGVGMKANVWEFSSLGKFLFSTTVTTFVCVC